MVSSPVIETPQISSQLIKDNLHLVKRIVSYRRRTLPSCIDYDELIQVGSIGLWKGLETLDLKKQINPENYLMDKIWWEISDFLRSCDHLSRQERKRVREGEDSVNGAEIISYEDSYQEYYIPDETYDIVRMMNDKQIQDILHGAIASLDDKHAECIRLTFLEEMKGVDIAKRLGVTGSRVTQIRNEGIKMLREIMPGCVV